MKLLVRNLPRTTTEAELREMFESYGRLQSCSLVMDEKTGTSKGFGFVEMPKLGEAKAAVKSLNGQLLDGKPIRVKKAEERPEPAAAAETTVPEAVEEESGQAVPEAVIIPEVEPEAPEVVPVEPEPEPMAKPKPATAPTDAYAAWKK